MFRCCISISLICIVPLQFSSSVSFLLHAAFCWFLLLDTLALYAYIHNLVTFIYSQHFHGLNNSVLLCLFKNLQLNFLPNCYQIHIFVEDSWSKRQYIIEYFPFQFLVVYSKFLPFLYLDHFFLMWKFTHLLWFSDHKKLFTVRFLVILVYLIKST